MYIIDNPNMLQNFLARGSNNSAVSYVWFQVRLHAAGNLSNYHHSFTFTGLQTGSRWLLAGFFLAGNIVQPELRWYKRSLLLVRGSRDSCIWSQPMADQVPLKRRSVCPWSCHYATLKFLKLFKCLVGMTLMLSDTGTHSQLRCGCSSLVGLFCLPQYKWRGMQLQIMSPPPIGAFFL